MTCVIDYAYMKALINHLKLLRVPTKQYYSLLVVHNDQMEL